jgi:phosphomannomutase
VVVDAVNASGSVIVPQLLRELGYEVIELYCDSSGVFPHTPEPLAENLTALGEAVRTHNAAFGVAVDPDADRLVLYDHHGDPIGEEMTVTLATQAVLAAAPAGQHVVVNYSTTRMVDDVANAASATTHRAPVGEINVVRRMQQVGAIIGGEGSGGVIMPTCHSGRDSLVGIGVITSFLRERSMTLADAAHAVPQYVMIKTKHELTDRAALSTALPRIAEAFRERATVSTEDGVHAAFSDRWVHVRGSNTEPIMRIIAEAPTRADADALIEIVTSMLHA